MQETAASDGNRISVDSLHFEDEASESIPIPKE
jgi:hypothetical protein